MLPKLYVLVRGNLSKSQQAVQAGHAIAQFLLDWPEERWKNDALVLLRVSTAALSLWRESLGCYSAYYESHYGDSLTAIATPECPPEFASLPLL